ncbi:hypothetical protein ABL78_3686 [Leptomonas seymouri]|uniref:Uncharacterized protein n=1 Tax=Leptomonas seymouri TaxID=5684 RepID=A0A0N0P648_LEPSE|nr:hypothetical protein ABL78_3686 [Leptomonas seymouri]|eukprot:KPI87216.1 hypothetical protein ABL78_3686 [Leptomonas seymouri]
MHKTARRPAKRRKREQKQQQRPSPLPTEVGGARVVPQAPTTLQQTLAAVEAGTSSSAAACAASAKRDIRDAEKALLRYFGRARHHYNCVPLHKATAALQCASNTQAHRVPFATLFPSPTLPSPPPSQTPITEAADNTDARPRATNSDGAPSSSPPLADESPFTAPNLFLGYDRRLRQFPDFAKSCLLNTRFGNLVDGNKLYGAREVQLLDISEDVSAVWATLRIAWEDLLRRHSSSRRTALRIPLHQSICFLLCFAQSQQSMSITSSMQCIVRDAMKQCEASRTASSHIFAVVPVYIGLNAPIPSHPLSDSCVEYASGGLYTCSAVVQCFSQMKPHTCTVAPPSAGGDTRLHRLDAHIFLLSDSWLNARSVADLHSGHHRAAQAETAASIHSSFRFDSPRGEGAGSKPGAGTAKKPCLSFIPDASRSNIHVFPGVMVAQLSPTERAAFGSFLWSTMRRVCGKEGGTHAQRPSD